MIFKRLMVKIVHYRPRIMKKLVTIWDGVYSSPYVKGKQWKDIGEEC